MTTREPLVKAIEELLDECFRGGEAGPVWFLDDEGLLATLRRLPAVSASRPTGDGGASIAGHTEHVRWFVALLNAFARGERPQIDWAESWTVEEIDEGAWERLVAELEREYVELRDNVATSMDSGDERRLKAVLATLVHVGYHIGAIRQMSRLRPD